MSLTVEIATEDGALVGWRLRAPDGTRLLVYAETLLGFRVADAFVPSLGKSIEYRECPLRALAEQPAQPVAQESVGYVIRLTGKYPTGGYCGDVYLSSSLPAKTKLYAAPAAPQPLTDEQVFADDGIMEANAHAGLPMRWLLEIVRAVERAHGIGATP